MPAKPFNQLLILLVFVVLVRLLTLQLYPLMDTTEARYAEIGRIMYETGDWITPYVNYDVPFWGKPPLSFWLTAASYKLFGISEFSARFPSWLCGIGTLCLLFFAGRPFGINRSLSAVLVCASSLIFFVSMGAVMTEASLVVSVTLSMVAAIKVLGKENHHPVWPYLFFVGLALGMLAKGPIAVVLTGSPLLMWALIHRRFRQLWKEFPWIRGVLLFGLISFPWYLLAESRTPGFLKYFIIGEHFLRFIDPGWGGDLYGTAHEEVRGKIWLLWLVAAFPWSFIAIGAWIKKIVIIKNLKNFFEGWQEIDFLLLYFSVFPMIFFSFSGNILVTYVVPGIPALSLLLARRFGIEDKYDLTQVANTMKSRPLYFSSLAVPVLFSALILCLWVNPDLAKSEKALIHAAKNTHPNTPIVYLDQMEHSAQFYSEGRARRLDWNSSDYQSLLGTVFAIRKDSQKNYEKLISRSSLVASGRRYDLFELIAND